MFEGRAKRRAVEGLQPDLDGDASAKRLVLLAAGLGLVSAPPCFDNELGPFAEGESCWDESSIVHVTYCQKLDGTKRELVRQILHCEEPNGFCVTLGDKPPWAYLCGPVRGFGKE